MDKSILYIGQIIDPKEIVSYSGASNAGTQFEWNLVYALSKQEGVKVRAVSIPPVAAWPRDKRIVFRGSTRQVSDTLEISCPTFLNLPVLKQITQILGGYVLGAKVLRHKKSDWIMSYNAYPQVGLAAYWLSKKEKLRHLCVLADVPFDDRAEQSVLRKAIWALYGGLAWKLIGKISHFVILNQNTAGLLPPESRYCVIEGAIDPKNYPYECISRHDSRGRKIILYSGALTEYSGILTLIEAVKQLPPDQFVLHIYGNGDIKERILEEAEHSGNVVYCGNVPIEKMRELQANAWLLVNPRKTDNEISRYTFPSKILEYMASGTPVLSTKIDGLPEKYFDFLFLVDADDRDGFFEKILEISQRDEAKIVQFGALAKGFVLREKSWELQAERLADLLG